MLRCPACLILTVRHPPTALTAADAVDAAYDGDAPHTEFVSRRELRRLCKIAGFEKFRATLENINQEPPFANRPRWSLLATNLPAKCGLDIYFEVNRPI